MKLKFYLLKRFAIIFKFLLLWMTMDGQVFECNDISTIFGSEISRIDFKANNSDLILTSTISFKSASAISEAERHF